MKTPKQVDKLDYPEPTSYGQTAESQELQMEAASEHLTQPEVLAEQVQAVGEGLGTVERCCHELLETSPVFAMVAPLRTAWRLPTALLAYSQANPDETLTLASRIFAPLQQCVREIRDCQAACKPHPEA